jgi:hypothetical protein
LLGLLIAGSLPCRVEALGSADLTFTDLWDTPRTLRSICDAERTLLFVCEPDLATCREGAVFFDSQADRIRSHRIEPACIFVGSPEEVRDAVLRMDIGISVYIDSEGKIFEELIGQRVLPAMALLDSSCNVTRTLYGGGESLPNNLNLITADTRPSPHRPLALTLIVMIAVGILLLVID